MRNHLISLVAISALIISCTVAATIPYIESPPAQSDVGFTHEIDRTQKNETKINVYFPGQIGSYKFKYAQFFVYSDIEFLTSGFIYGDEKTKSISYVEHGIEASKIEFLITYSGPVEHTYTLSYDIHDL